MDRNGHNHDQEGILAKDVLAEDNNSTATASPKQVIQLIAMCCMLQYLPPLQQHQA